MKRESAESAAPHRVTSTTSRLSVWIALPLLFLAAGASRAQSSRADAIALEQSEKSERLEVEGPGPFERGLVVVMRSPLLAGTGGAYPWFGNAHIGTGTAFGAGYLRRLPRRARVNVLAATSFGGSSLLDVTARLPQVQRGLLTVELGARRIVANDLTFFGLGPESSEDVELEYEYRPTQFSSVATLRPHRWLRLSGEYRRLGLTTEPISLTEPIDTPALGSDLAYHVVRTSAAFDWRTAEGYTTRGGLYRVSWSRYNESRGQPFSFELLEYEAVQHFPVLREQFGFAARALVTLTRTDDGERVPFVLTPFLGSGDTLRGFTTWRFTDRNRLLLTAEYRWRPSRFMDMAVFVDAGKVAPTARGLNLENLETSWGIGARFHGPSFTALRAEVAKSREGWRLVIGTRQAF